MLYTNLKHIESADELSRIINNNENVMVICGRMEPQCVPVFRIAEELESEYANVKYYDMEYDNPESMVIRTLPELSGLTGIPFAVYYKNGIVVKTTSGIQTKDEVVANLESEFEAEIHA
ncbi:MAG: thioredoxin family protein [Prolixibacteraceae bacterium]